MLETRGGASNVWEWRTRAEKKTPAIRYFLCFFLKESPRYSENLNGRSPLHGCLQQTIARVATRKSL